MGRSLVNHEEHEDEENMVGLPIFVTFVSS